MDIGIQKQFVVESSEQAKKLEDALRDFPVRITTENHAKLGDSPKINITGDRDRVTVRPYRCNIATVEILGDVEIISKNDGSSSTEDFLLYELQKDDRKYFIINSPIFYSEWK